ncbi:uncharacterized protein Z520_10834 [Fonsecaea multimorphosa CBS 102226]|uniref:Tr-type G domain-containing protein n=1 Tax=Fonsecaea multimorphosa CBS 102226 TaxID=1442371 RepID=A0A0D2GV62_9EURO|nr:uncharacterized protein Z520_10834 [Fonsecaea multimorphosa CBS 102226]KIX93415.1 hypothetical protein Z520_10834 [Fonsecaea multimorphosa CBS 102226]OAL18713.1 hypothetical protein AYO22_10406 [Fonsecaea multimorphosa]
MASIFTYQDEPARIHSPWSTPGTSTPQQLHSLDNPSGGSHHITHGLMKLEPERQDGPTEYKLHLLLRPRRKFLSATTTCSVYGSQPYTTPVQSAVVSSRSPGDSLLDRPTSQPSAQARQNRLQQLTTQLLWRLQQSSPFHSSSNADLVLPLLPEATPKLGVPERPAKLLPGLEESQGALYEIGVADDGMLAGLVEDELQESLTNLKAMAASLGCTTNILRKVPVGTCEWVESGSETGHAQTRKDALWVAEVLVYPDSRGSADADIPRTTLDMPAGSSESEDGSDLADHASTDQIRVTLVGATAAGKSSLLGTLSTSTLDNGRGKSRLSLLKHRHEIASGITSSVAHELIGYWEARHPPNTVINYASGNVSSWLDIHNLAKRLVLLSDSPGLPKFSKSAFRSLISWRPSWTILCVAANDSDEAIGRSPAMDPQSYANNGIGESGDLSLSYLDLCLRLQVPLMVVITKMDIATKAGLRLVLARILSAVKAAGRKPVMLSNMPGPVSTPEQGVALSELQTIYERDQTEVERLVESMQSDPGQGTVPILMTSAVTGLGISKLHALFRTIPAVCKPRQSPWPGPAVSSSLFHVDEVFSIPPSRVYTLDTEPQLAKQGIVLCGHLSYGLLSVGDTMLLGPFNLDTDGLSNPISPSVLRANSYAAAESSYAEGSSSVLARSYQGEAPQQPTRKYLPSAIFLRVRIVSLRTLRLPVMRMHNQETGTIGVEPLDGEHTTVALGRARKGMVLTDINQHLAGYRSFSARFPTSDFAQTTSPVLILGGHAIVYINSVRAAAKVTAVALDEDEQSGKYTSAASSRDDAELFRLDIDDDVEGGFGDGDGDRGKPSNERREIRVSFRFGSTIEWMEVGDQVVVVPTMTATGPVTGPAPIANTGGLSGFVGTVCEVFS